MQSLYSAGKRSHSSPLQSGFQCGFVYAMSITKENQTVAERYAGHICPQARLAVHSGCMQLRAWLGVVVTIEGVVKARAQEFPRSAYCKVTIVQMNVYVLQLHDMDTWMIS